MLLFALLIRSQITETPTYITYNPADIDRKFTYVRAKSTPSGIELRSGADGGSIINFNESNPENEWTFEYKITNLELTFPQRAGIYIWYTNKPVEDGIYKGSDGIFSGLMSGIELMGKTLSLVLSTNDGKNDFTELDKDELLTYRDSVNPERFRNVKELRVKVISTLRNFKVEIYDDEKLLYDSFRHLSPEPLADLSKGKFFSITTEYEKVNMNKFFILKDVKVYKRVENEDYDPFKVAAPEPDSEPRIYDAINHSSREVQHLISNVEHLIKYSKSHIGKPQGLALFKGLNDARAEIERMAVNIENLLMEYELRKNSPVESVIKLAEKFKMIEDKMGYLSKSLGEVQDFLTRYDVKHTKRSGHFILLIFLGLLLVSLLSVVRFVANKKGKRE